MSRVKMFFLGDLPNWYKKNKANIQSKQMSGLYYLIKSDRYNNLIKSIRKYAYTKIGLLEAEGYYSSEPLYFENKLQGEFVKLKKGTIWAKNTFDCMWMHCVGHVNENVGNIENIKCRIDIGGEGLIYDTQGNALQGITTFVSEFDYALGKPAKLIVQSNGILNNGKIEFWIDAAANDLFGKFQENAKIKCLEIVKENCEIRALAYDMEVLISACDYLDIAKAKELYRALGQVYKKCKFPMTEKIASECRQILKPLFNKNENICDFEYSAIGHGHLDLAWLWPIRESYRKGLRTFSTQIMNMEKYEDYYFGASQAQLFDWIKSLDKNLFSKIHNKVEDGQLELQGATWVEMDSNLISMESLIRQFYYGKKYFKQEFGADMKILWLPDSFGYSPCLPQIMKLSNVPYFVTQKMSWNTVTKFPYHTFNWVGLDGSEVFAHMLPNNSYNSPNRADNLIFGMKNFQEKNISNKALTLFGIGDGGAGPGFEHIERARRLKNLSPIPKVKMGKAIDFFDDVVKEKNKFNYYKGELYLEKHQGTYTTQALVKYYNRKCEFALRNYEMLIALIPSCELPISLTELEILWKEILLYQFHDILPGSSINRVYDECIPRYKSILDKLNNAINQVLANLKDGKGFFNPNSYDLEHYFNNDNKWYVINLPKLSCLKLENTQQVNDIVKSGKDFIENDKVKIVFEKGMIAYYYDKLIGKNFVAENGKFLKYSIYRDYGDCWDMRKNYANSKCSLKLHKFEINSDGVKVVALSEFVLRDIKIIQEVILIGNEDFARVKIHVNNNRNKSMLRVEFESSVYTDKCAFNTQCGHIYRATTNNTKAELAQYEVSGQKFVDLSDDNYGLTVINDCKYGFKCKKNIIDINLLRSPRNPAYNVDQGEFDVQLAIFTHKGSVNNEVYKRSYILNNPIIEYTGSGNITLNNIEINNDNVILESVKIADNGGIIARVYNSSEKAQEFMIIVDNYLNAEIVDILENKIDDFKQKTILKPFEILNVRFFD